MNKIPMYSLRLFLAGVFASLTMLAVTTHAQDSSGIENVSNGGQSSLRGLEELAHYIETGEPHPRKVETQKADAALAAA